MPNQTLKRCAADDIARLKNLAQKQRGDRTRSITVRYCCEGASTQTVVKGGRGGRTASREYRPRRSRRAVEHQVAGPARRSRCKPDVGGRTRCRQT
jgi:hypothetical protein